MERDLFSRVALGLIIVVCGLGALCTGGLLLWTGLEVLRGHW